MTISQTLAADFRFEAANTRKMLEAVPADQFDWQPHEKSWTLGQLASHLAETPDWVLSMEGPELDFATVTDYTPFAAADRDQLLAEFDKNLEACAAFIEGKDDEFLEEVWIMRHGDTVMIEQPRHEVIRSIAIHHSIHHRGQLTVYLRMVGAAVPPTYGPTADSSGAA